jgi:hypothetical protein
MPVTGHVRINASYAGSSSKRRLMMRLTSKTIGVLDRGISFFVGKVVRFAAGISLALLISGPAFAQYTGTGTGTSSPSYGSGTAIGIGVGAAAGGAVVLYLVLHHAGSVTGCVQSGQDGLRLADKKNKKTYALLPGGADLKTGELVELQGKKSQAGTAGESFQPKKLVKNLGSCGAPTAMNDNLSLATSAQSAHDSPQE